MRFRLPGSFSLLLFLLSCTVPAPAQSGSMEEAWQALREGKHAKAIDLAHKNTDQTWAGEDWALIVSRARFETGNYQEAQTTISNALRRNYLSIRLRFQAHEIYRESGKLDLANAVLGQINELVRNRDYAYRDPTNLVVIGKTALLLRADPKLVLVNFFEQAIARAPECLDAYLAAGNLALAKQDYQLASKKFQQGLKRFPKDPDLLWGMASALAASHNSEMSEFAEQALEINENHLPSLLLLAGHLIDAEQYELAETNLRKVLSVNPHQPEAWAYRAVIAHVQNRPENEKSARNKALQLWNTNPKVDYLIGQKLAQKYRFAEAAEYQRSALKMDPDYLPAKIELAQDLLRLGEEEEGWRIAEEVHQKDAYDVTAYNLAVLSDTLEKYTTLTNRDFILRMTPNEAGLYGERALQLLSDAKARLCAKYKIELNRPTIVELFANQHDFGVRTFGMPHNPGFLGVCFGPVITANSPASQSHPQNWQSVLWHEFCHVITLQMTKNKMPRWLSEGISVYEEQQANPAWGQGMTPEYRQKIMEGKLKKLGELSSAFLNAESHEDVIFAYFESALAVEFLIQRFGHEGISKILHDLGEGLAVNEAIEKNTAPLKELEKEFDEFARLKAESYGTALDWTEPDPGDFPTRDSERLAQWLEKHPNNYHGLREYGAALVTEKKWDEAEQHLKRFIELLPEQGGGPSSALRLLARVYREQKKPEAERDVLNRISLTDSTAVDVYTRLMEIESDRENWEMVIKQANRFLAVDPLEPGPYRFLARAAQATGQRSQAISGYQQLLKFELPDAAQVNYQLATLYRGEDDVRARHHVLRALEQAPRFRDAHRLLLQLAPAQPPAPTPSSAN